MLYAKNVRDLYKNCGKDVHKLLGKYSRSFVYNDYESEELEQGFYYMLLKRDVIERFDITVTNIDKVFTSYMCECIKGFCREERRRLRKERALMSRHQTEIENDEGKSVCIFESAQYAWAEGSRSGARFSTEGGHASLTEIDGTTYEKMVADLCEALNRDSGLSQVDKSSILALVSKGACGASAGELAEQLDCRPSKISGLRRQAKERYYIYKAKGYV